LHTSFNTLVMITSINDLVVNHGAIWPKYAGVLLTGVVSYLTHVCKSTMLGSDRRSVRQRKIDSVRSAQPEHRLDMKMLLLLTQT